MTEKGTTYVSDVMTSLSPDGKVLTMAEHYREPGLERVRDWVFEKQQTSTRPHSILVTVAPLTVVFLNRMAQLSRSVSG